MDKPAPWHSYGKYMMLLLDEDEEKIRQEVALDVLQYMLKAGEDLNRYRFEFVIRPEKGFHLKTVAFKAELRKDTLTDDERESWKAYERYQREQMKTEYEELLK